MRHSFSAPVEQPQLQWEPGQNPLTRERPFAARTITPFEAALYTACLGPAICLGADGVIWLLLLVLLPLNCLVLAAPAWPYRFSQARGTWLSLLLLAGVPFQAAGVAWLLRVTGIRAGLPVLELSLLLAVHTGAFLYLQQVCTLRDEERRSWSERSTFLLPVPLIGLWALGALERLPGALPPGLAGLPRTVGLLVLLGVIQLWLRRRARRVAREVE